MNDSDGVITELMAEKTFNLGNYESLKIGARVSVSLCGSVEKAEAKLISEIGRLKQLALAEAGRETGSHDTKWVTTRDKHGFETYHEGARE